MTKDLLFSVQSVDVSGIFQTAKAITAHRPLVNAAPIHGMGTGGSGHSCTTRARILSRGKQILFRQMVDDQRF
jgi:hypothetical protein